MTRPALRTDRRAVRWPRRLLFAALLLGIVTMHTLGHPSRSHAMVDATAVAAVAPAGRAADHTAGRAPALTPDHNLALTPDHTAGPAPDHTEGRPPALTPDHTARLTPDHTPGQAPALTPDHTARLTPDHTAGRPPALTPDHTARLTPDYTAGRAPERAAGPAPGVHTADPGAPGPAAEAPPVGSGMDPMSVCLAVLGGLTLLILGAGPAGLRDAAPLGGAARAPGRSGGPDPPSPRELLTRLAVLRV
ncbi:hypothetical protein OG723_12635 [Streptomyces sp. NBC_01278]|uniref:hypothetical protein n=1 Tax=Streptomyces sp. NBC_01278 TaxID=2903809 RepID=UPI002E32B5FE|nr:hypothetical protein [Streptomyces sp. NBC_01278]